MPAPGFTAEMTLYRSGERRASTTTSAQAEGNSVTPASWRDWVSVVTSGPLDLLGDTWCRAKCWGAAGAIGGLLCPETGPLAALCAGGLAGAASVCSDACAA
jgi:hypothetical protein